MKTKEELEEILRASDARVTKAFAEMRRSHEAWFDRERQRLSEKLVAETIAPKVADLAGVSPALVLTDTVSTHGFKNEADGIRDINFQTSRGYNYHVSGDDIDGLRAARRYVVVVAFYELPEVAPEPPVEPTVTIQAGRAFFGEPK